jgi:hypothetical protein
VNDTQTLEAFHAAADRAEVAFVKLRRAREEALVDWGLIQALNSEIDVAIAETISLSERYGYPPPSPQ